MSLPILYIIIFVVSFFIFNFKKKKQSKTFKKIPNTFKTISEVQNAIREEGLESSNLIIGVDFTKSNEWTGKFSFGGHCLHSLSNGQNPYQAAIEIIGETLSTFDDDGLIPAFGFGDVITTDKHVFPFKYGGYCLGFQEVLSKYNEIARTVVLSGPTSFAPLIREAIKIVIESGYSYHILVIIADGQITNKEENVKAIVEASNYPLSIIMVGVGDGPWDGMEEFDDELPQRKFDNFQFVNFTEIMRKYDGNRAAFALSALMEIPYQYKYIKELGLLSQKTNH